MSYISTLDDHSVGSTLGCGPTCNCGPCKSGLSGLGERYVKEEAALGGTLGCGPTCNCGPCKSGVSGLGERYEREEPEEEVSRPGGSNRPAARLSGWGRPAPGLGHYGLFPAGAADSSALQRALQRGIRNPR